VIRNNINDIHYEFPVHEYITWSRQDYTLSDILLGDHFYIFQDRLLDKPSVGRVPQDIKMLLDYINIHGVNMRAYRYLIESYKNLKDFPNVCRYCEKLIEYYEKNKPVEYMYFDDYYLALRNKGYAYYSMDIDEFYKWFLKAYKHAKLLYDNAEPLVMLSSCYLDKNNLQLSYLYLKKACEIPNPPDTVTESVVNYHLHLVQRWELMSVVAYKVDKLNDYYKALEMLKQVK
jgi:tetratricopeptide (TPR) repeat protein